MKLNGKRIRICWLAQRSKGREMSPMEMERDFEEMVRIPSESGNEEDFLVYLKNKFERVLNATCVFDDFGNLIVRLDAKDSSRKRPILFGVHGDTVKPGIGIEPILKDGVYRSSGNTILGADDKAGIAELIEAIRTSSQYPPLEIVVTREEETGLAGAKHLDLSLLQSDMGFVLDMEDVANVVIGGPSHMLIDVEIEGKGAHAGMEPEKGISAIRAASYAITFLKEGWVDKRTTVNVGIIEGGEIRNGVPERVVLKAECRSLDHDKCKAQANEIKTVFESIPSLMGAKASVTLTLAYQAFSLDEKEAVVEVAKKALLGNGIEPKLTVITGGTDGSIYNACGIPTVALGVGMRDAHTVDESIFVSDMRSAVKNIQAILRMLC